MPFDVEHIASIRKKINELDETIIPLMIQRFAHTHDVEKRKIASLAGLDQPIKSIPREMEIFSKLELKVKEHMAVLKDATVSDQKKIADAMTQVYSEIFSQALNLEQRQSIATLGPAGSWSDLATQSFFGSAIDIEHCKDIPQIFQAVEQKLSYWGLVPIENSSNGPVNLTLDSFEKNGLTIVGEHTIFIDHCVAGLQNSTSSGLQQRKKIYGHTQSLDQCASWIRDHLNHDIELVPVSSSSQGILQVKDDPDALVLCAKNSAIKQELSVFAQSIDHEKNQTRFAVIGREKDISTQATDNDKTTIKVRAGEKQGILFEILEEFKKNQVNLGMLHSRPSREQTWAYVFYIEIEGNQEEPHVAAALSAIKSKVISLQILGSYPFGRLVSP